METLFCVAGLRALVKKDAEAIKRLVEQEDIDVLCLQEHKLQEKHVKEVEPELLMDGWKAFWNCSEKAGYSGTAILYRSAAFPSEPRLSAGIQVEAHDNEGRVITMDAPEMYIVNVYVPNAGAFSFEAA
jgi:exodeoxyribonuclease III